MIKFVMCARRNPALSAEAFRDYWLNHHGVLFKRHAEAYRAVRYVQSHTIDSSLNASLMASRGTAPAYDGIGEIWWRSEEEFRAVVSAAESQQLRKLFIEDEKKFLDLSASSAFFTTEHVLIDGKV